MLDIIPKIIHYCWFGGNPLPKDALECIASWRKYLPDYEIKEWNESNFDVNCCPYVKQAYEAKKYAFVSDYVRFFVLFKEGGLYFDTDVEIIKDMNHIIAVGPGLEIIGELLDLYNARENFAIADGTVVDYTTEILKRHGMVNEHRFQKVADVNIYPADYFCPMDSTTGIITKTKNTVAIHHYSCSWIDHNTMSWRIHVLKNKLIAIFGERWIMKISQLLRR